MRRKGDGSLFEAKFDDNLPIPAHSNARFGIIRTPIPATFERLVWGNLILC